METLLIEIRNPKGLNLIRDLEEMDIIRIVKREGKPQPQTAQKLSERFAGKLPQEEGEALQKYINESRNEWERTI
ncbi:hypothetical protein [Runella sp.]|uniref:hypothetical protein n=1 Tax=Runella sp. TaxID=1960881 RepID=UPI003D1399FE